MYRLFNDGDLAKVAALFAADAEYPQLEGPEAVVTLGRERIQEVLERWRYFFGDNRRIEDITIIPAHDRPVRVPTGETVWLNSRGEFVRVENTMKIVALTN